LSRERLKPLTAMPINPVLLDLDTTIHKDETLDDGNWSFLDSLDSVPSSPLVGQTAAWFGLRRFFLQLPKAGQKAIEVYHWGDSQIEGDRISGELRKSWQARWGGHGPGWALPVMPAPHGHIRAAISGDLLRQTGFGRRRDTSALTLPFLAVNRIPTQATWCVMAARNEKPPAGWTLREIWSLTPPAEVHEHDVVTTEDTLTFSKDTLRGVFLGSRKGVMVHNLPMRGASGTTLNRLDPAEWEWLAATHPPSMVLLQFGGNAVPGMTKPKQAHWYAQNMGRLVRNIRERFPSVVVVFVGPSDMGLRPQDYPGLPWVIAALAEEITEAGGMFWDLQSAMGGPGSMADWHAKGWAASDHIHFSKRGAREAAKRFEQALWLAWRDMRNSTGDD
jgi:lysophospholipase L1-like esterase